MGYYDLAGDDDMSGLDTILGEYDLSGDEAAGEDELLGLSLRAAARGALMPHTLAMRALRGRRRAAQIGARGPIAKSKGISRSRRLILPLDSSTTIAAGATQTLTLTPTNVFKPDRFVVDPAVAPNFVINDIKVGRASQFIGTGAVPGTAFSPNLGENNIGFDTVQTSQPFSVSVTNTSGAALRFMGAFLGWEVE